MSATTFLVSELPDGKFKTFLGQLDSVGFPDTMQLSGQRLAFAFQGDHAPLRMQSFIGATMFAPGYEYLSRIDMANFCIAVFYLKG